MIKRDLINQIFDEAYTISKTTPDDVFFQFSPHVDWIEFQVFLGGWSRENDEAQVRYRIMIDEDSITSIRKVLRGIKELRG